MAAELRRYMREHAAADARGVMPTHKQLVAAGFSGLRYALKKHGASDAAGRLGLTVRGRGRPP